MTSLDLYFDLSADALPPLPPHCSPTSPFLINLSSIFQTCIPTPLALLSTTLGTFSLISWLFAQLPQIYKNYSISSTAGLSIWFLAEWCLGDVSNLLGAFLTRQTTLQVIIAGYYCLVDFILVLQWLYYERLQHGSWTVRRYWVRGKGERITPPGSIIGVDGVSISDADSLRSRPSTPSAARDIAGLRTSGSSYLTSGWRFSATPEEKNGSAGKSAGSTVSPSSRGTTLVPRPGSSYNGPSPRTVLFIACLASLCRAAPSHSTPPAPILHTAETDALRLAGTIFAWLSTALYLLSRLPQLYRNHVRRSTSGLSPLLFAAAFFGNLFYSASLVANPLAWSDYGPYGGSGWADAEGSVRAEWIAAALPFWLGAAGVLFLDGMMGVQFAMYGEASRVVVVEEVDRKRKRKRWMRVSGYMRGWIPSFVGVAGGSKADLGVEARQRLLPDDREQGAYGTIS